MRAASAAQGFMWKPSAGATTSPPMRHCSHRPTDVRVHPLSLCVLAKVATTRHASYRSSASSRRFEQHNPDPTRFTGSDMGDDAIGPGPRAMAPSVRRTSRSTMMHAHRRGRNTSSQSSMNLGGTEVKNHQVVRRPTRFPDPKVRSGPRDDFAWHMSTPARTSVLTAPSRVRIMVLRRRSSTTACRPLPFVIQTGSLFGSSRTY